MQAGIRSQIFFWGYFFSFFFWQSGLSWSAPPTERGAHALKKRALPSTRSAARPEPPQVKMGATEAGKKKTIQPVRYAYRNAAACACCCCQISASPPLPFPSEQACCSCWGSVLAAAGRGAHAHARARRRPLAFSRRAAQRLDGRSGRSRGLGGLGRRSGCKDVGASLRRLPSPCSRGRPPLGRGLARAAGGRPVAECSGVAGRRGERKTPQRESGSNLAAALRALSTA